MKTRNDLLESLGFSKEYLQQLDDFEKNETVKSGECGQMMFETMELAEATDAILAPDSKSFVNMAIVE